jgi:OmpA-OmpF porin, OOP family
MSTKAIITLLALLAWILFCNWWWCSNKEECDCDKLSNTEVLPDANITNNTGVIQFNANANNPITNSNWALFADSICNLVRGGKRLEIVGYYGADEQNTTAFANLGIARADTIKQLLLAKLSGISASRIATAAELRSDISTANTNAFDANSILVKDTIATPSDAGGVVATDSNDIIIYFPTGSAVKEASKEVDDYLTILGARLKANGAKAQIIGHTDNKGNAAKNLELSKQRAEFVQQILVKHEAPAANLAATGKGDAEPIGDNNTDAGRRQNRRVNIKITQ